jgi:hypothetical protein
MYGMYCLRFSVQYHTDQFCLYVGSLMKVILAFLSGEIVGMLLPFGGHCLQNCAESVMVSFDIALAFIVLVFMPVDQIAPCASSRIYQPFL